MTHNKPRQFTRPLNVNNNVLESVLIPWDTRNFGIFWTPCILLTNFRGEPIFSVMAAGWF